MPQARHKVHLLISPSYPACIEHVHVQDNSVENFVSQMAINVRHHVNASNDQMGLYIIGYFDVHQRPTTFDQGRMRTAARDMSKKFYTCANTLQDQSIGLLRFLPVEYLRRGESSWGPKRVLY